MTRDDVSKVRPPKPEYADLKPVSSLKDQTVHLDRDGDLASSEDHTRMPPKRPAPKPN